MPKGLLVCFYEHGIKALNQISNPFWPPPPLQNSIRELTPLSHTYPPPPPRSHAYTVLFKPTTNEDKFTNVTQDYIMVLKNGISDINIVVIFKK
jgi:histidinol-phosphate/aromatic aminotransferase/cobyric acid decarboxylase-like protein